MIDANNTADFIQTLGSLFLNRQKLIRAFREGNRLIPYAEIRDMPTAGGGRFGIATINMLNQRSSGIYTTELDEVTLHAMYIQDVHPSCEWFLVDDCYHGVETLY